MSWDVSTFTEPVARKEYRCDASDWLRNSMYDDDFTPAELAVFNKAKAENFKIQKGMKYRKTSGIWDGESMTFMQARERRAATNIRLTLLLDNTWDENERRGIIFI